VTENNPVHAPGAAFLAAALDDEIVLLDLARGQLILLDRAAARVWRACGAAATAGGRAERRATGILRRLARAGAVVRQGGDRWVQARVRWI
jgi:hypothetical protein